MRTISSWLSVRRRASAKALALIGLCVILASIGAGIWAWRQFAGDKVVVRTDLPPGSIRAVGASKPLPDSSRAIVLNLIPSDGLKSTHSDILVPADVAKSAQAIQIALADPIAAARAAKPADSKVLQWMLHWQTSLQAKTPISAQERDELNSILKTTSLGWQTLFQIGRQYRDVSGDALTASLFYEAAVVRADAEVRRYGPHAPEITPILTAMNDARRLLWDVVDNVNPQDRPSLEALAIVSADLVQYVTPGDPLLGDARRHGLIGVPECMFALGHPTEAIPLLLNLDTTGMTENEMLGIEWIRGLSLYQDHRDSEAIDHLKVVAKDNSYQYSEQACRYIVLCTVETGRLEEARAMCAVYEQRYGNDLEYRYLAGVVRAQDSIADAIKESQ